MPWLVFAALSALQPARAAEVTRIPAPLRAEFLLVYGYDHLAGSLSEEDESVGRRTWDTHSLDYELSFSPVAGVALFVGVPQYLSSRISFDDVHEMVYDPADDQGTMLGTNALSDPPVFSGSGFGGLWYGLRLTPWNTAFPNRDHLVTWLLEAALESADQDNFWTVHEDGRRGAGPGGRAFRLRSAWSTRAPTDAYLQACWLHRAPFTADLLDEDGSVLVQDQELDPAEEISVRAGTELEAYANDVSMASFRVDLHLGFGYRSWQTVPSGVLLPSVLPESRSIPVTESEYAWASVGTGFLWRPFRYLQLDLLGELRYPSPHQIEHAYPVYAGTDTYEVLVTTGMHVLTW